MDGLTFGSISATDNTTAEAITDATLRKITAFDTNGEGNRVTVDHTANTLTAEEAGTYKVWGTVSFSGSLSKTFLVSVYKNDATAVGVPCERKLGTGGDVGSAPFCATVQLAVGDTVSACHWSVDLGSLFTVQQIYLEMMRVL